MVKKKVLYIGLTGRIGPGLIDEYEAHYKKYYDITIGYHKTKPKSSHPIKKIDLSSISKLKSRMKGFDVVVNLAANADANAEFKDLVEPNIMGAYNVLEAARLSGVKRVIVASSVHAIRGYPLGKQIKTNYAPKPLNFYGATKVFNEALCHVFSIKYNLSCLAIRIGAYVSNDQQHTVCMTRDNFDYVISQRDMGQLIHKSIMAPAKVKYGILAGTSNNKHKYMNLEETKKLVGYKPKDDGFQMCKHHINHMKDKK
ncbi:MAG: uronate dehydrogenase [Patescibacteria group bacterium]|jgi:uronate dehydrogenase